MSRRTAPRRLRPHPFTADTWTDWRGQPLCRCGQLKDATCHDMPDVDPAITAEEARRLGERTEP